MKRLSVAPAIALLASCSPCGGPSQGRIAPTTTSSITTRPATSEPAAATRPAPRQTVRRPTRYRLLLLGCQEEYLRHEGAGHRGKWFAQLAGCLSHLDREDPPVTQLEALEVLGHPDYGASEEKGAVLVYVFFDEGRKRDEVMNFHFNADGLLFRVGFNAASAYDLAKFTRYPDFIKPPAP